MFILMCAVDDSTGNKIWLKYSLVLDHHSHEDPKNFPLYNINFWLHLLVPVFLGDSVEAVKHDG